MKYFTFKEWAEQGYEVKKGEKAVERDAKGNGLFSSKQVKQSAKGYDDNYERRLDRDYDMDGR